MKRIGPKLLLIGVSQPYRDGFALWAKALGIDVVVSADELFGHLPSTVLCVIEATGDDPELLHARLLALRKLIEQAPTVVLARQMSLTTGVSLIKQGVRDVIELPHAVAEVVSRSAAFVDQSSASDAGTPLVGTSRAAKRLDRDIREAAATSSSVLLTGETGTGKSLAARMIHELSDRRAEPMIEVNCGVLAGSVIESELFGHERGAFTGASGARAGRFETAGAGTILLDEIGELDAATQVKLLRVLEDRVFERVGGSRPRQMHARVIAATNRDLDADISAERFRMDLFYRLNVLQIGLPPLRDRLGDIPSLVQACLEKLSKRLRVTPPPLTDETYERFAAHTWPGNIRELMNVLERILISHQSGSFDEESIGNWLGSARVQPAAPAEAAPAENQADEFETYYVALSHTGGNNHAVARLLGVTIQTVRSKLQKYPTLAEHRGRLRSPAPQGPRQDT
ncbi:MAG: sigma-54 dependent transcriptional regulator [Myxococcota bacterium]